MQPQRDLEHAVLKAICSRRREEGRMQRQRNKVYTEELTSPIFYVLYVVVKLTVG